jgi:hypothetical protein
VGQASLPAVLELMGVPRVSCHGGRPCPPPRLNLRRTADGGRLRTVLRDEHGAQFVGRELTITVAIEQLQARDGVGDFHRLDIAIVIRVERQDDVAGT